MPQFSGFYSLTNLISDSICAQVLLGPVSQDHLQISNLCALTFSFSPALQLGFRKSDKKKRKSENNHY